ncbi:hypothetical protein EVAR_22650_1 [Eumeta japonica]|uniref:Uncharacterized protein n=1 Tax=Eumeta variegata TaxID=151549 RepID=A0A4C1VNA7_EUMVA|nr:hypothetical protein EVAR_22650_1 [Eumeta japonica]
MPQLFHLPMQKNLPAWVLVPTAPRINPALSVTRYSTHDQPPPGHHAVCCRQITPELKSVNGFYEIEKSCVWPHKRYDPASKSGSKLALRNNTVVIHGAMCSATRFYTAP